MQKYIKYLKHTIKHKWYVFQECAKRGLVWRGLVHDLSKFSPFELVSYTHYFNGKYGKGKRAQVDRNFDHAWNNHQKHNKHHWQYWLLRNDDGKLIILEMPIQYALEMVCDWIGAGKAHGATDPLEIKKWYKKNKKTIQLHPNTRQFVESFIVSLET